MRVLAIETSCDETAVAVVERGDRHAVVAEKVKSQIPLHSRFGGVVPEIASRTHLEVIDGLCADVLEASRFAVSDMDLISVTQGPGLIGSLLVGLSFAKALARTLEIPLVPVDHIRAHIESAFISHREIEYPLIALVVSGGHTSLFYQPSKFEIESIAKTRDDAVGEVMDKIAKFFGLGYPGGPILDRVYASGDPGRFDFTFPRMSDGSDDFSFSGYKTAVLRHARVGGVDRENPAFNDLVASFLDSVVTYLLLNTRKAVEIRNARSVVVAGGVSRNSLLRERFRAGFERMNIPLYLPEARYCTDNAAMIGWLGYEIFRAHPRADYRDLSLNAYSRSTFRETGKHR